jgi:hypothetical protein
MFLHLDLIDFFKGAPDQYPAGVPPEIMVQQAIKYLPYSLPKQIAAARARCEGFIEVDAFWDVVSFENPGRGKILPGNPFAVRLDGDSYSDDRLCQLAGWSKDSLSNQLDVSDRQFEADGLLQPDLRSAIEIVRVVCGGAGHRICVNDAKPSPVFGLSAKAAFRRTIRIYFARSADGSK